LSPRGQLAVVTSRYGPAVDDVEVTMPEQIDRDGVRRLLDQGVQLVEVLPAGEYAEDHLPGAVNLPLRRLERQARQVLDRPDRWWCTAGTLLET
jgi:hypothetical protein